MSHEDKIKRRYFRFRPDNNTLADISFSTDLENFESEIVGLVYEEAYKGCGVVVLEDERFKEGTKLAIQCGEIEATVASIRWMDKVDPNVMRLGLEYDIPDLKLARKPK